MRLSTKHRAHLSEAFRWTPAAPLTLRTLALAAFAMGVPVLAGYALGKSAIGLVIGLGSMLLANEVPGQAAEGGHGLAAIGPALLAVPVALLLARIPWGDAVMVGLSVAASTLVNWSRPAAGGAVRFIVFLILNLGLAASGSGGGAHRGGAALLFGIGALWRTVLRRLFGKRHAAPSIAGPAGEALPARVVTPRQRMSHFRRTMRTLAGWQYPVRLGFGLTAAVLLRDLWPERHFGWVVLTIALLTPRALEHLPVQITQRVAGTLGGVALAGLILHLAPGHVALAVAVLILGIAAPLVRAGNYAAYCLLSTPVILLAMDAGAEGADGLLVDRLIATLSGAAVILVANFGMDWWLALGKKREARD